MIKLMKHQVANARFHLKHGRSCDFSEQGTGKTFTAIATIVSNDQYEKALIVCPKHLIYNWVKALREYGIPDEEVFVFQGNVKQREEQKELLLLGEKNIVVTNYGHFRVEAKFFEKYAKKYELYTVADEAHCLGSLKTAITKAFRKIWKAGSGFLFMTGTPIANSPVRVYPLLLMCDSEAYTSKQNFMNIHALTRTIRIPTKSGRTRPLEVITGWVNFKLLFDNIAKVGVRMTKEECLDLPERIFVTRRFEINALQRRMYKTALEQLIVEIGEGKEKEITNSLAKAMVLRQILSNPELVNSDLNLPLLPKEEVLLKDVENYDGKIVIFCNFVKTFYRLLELFGDKAVGIRGGEKDIRGKLTKFDTDPECRIFVGIRTACNTGLNLQVAHTMINYELDFDALEYSQGIDRIHRRGQKEKVVVIDYIAKITESFDLHVLNSLRAKESISREVLEKFMRKYLTEGVR